MPAGAKKDGPSLRQAQERLLAAIDHLKSVTESQNVAALKAERDTLMSGLDGLKGDYEVLERKYRQLKSELESDETARDDQQDAASLRAELDQVRQEYQALNRSFGLLKTQYLELQESRELASPDAPEPNPPGMVSPDLAALRGERDRLAEELARVKVDFERQASVLASLKAEYLALQENNEHVAIRLDAAIHRLEAVSAAN